jgi:hypothetical protein
MGRDLHERKHRRTAKHPAAAEIMANANFSAAGSLREAMGFAQPVLAYFEGEIFSGSNTDRTVRACWLADESGEAVCVVTEGADFEKSKVLLKHAAKATQAVAALLEACEAILRYLPDQNDLLNHAATNDGTASGYDCAAVSLRKAVAAAKSEAHDNGYC